MRLPYLASETLAIRRDRLLTRPRCDRIDGGGKLLTNHLKTLLSFRQYGLMDETHVVNEIKETCCVASRNFISDLNLCQCVSKFSPPDFAQITDAIALWRAALRRHPERNHLRQEYVLPDFTSADRMKGFIKSGPNARKKAPLDPAAAVIEAECEEDKQLLSLGSERFSVPEILFNPSDIGAPPLFCLISASCTKFDDDNRSRTKGLQQAGLGRAVADSIATLPSEIQGLFWCNVCLMGGNARIPELALRLSVGRRARRTSKGSMLTCLAANKPQQKERTAASQPKRGQPQGDDQQRVRSETPSLSRSLPGSLLR